MLNMLHRKQTLTQPVAPFLKATFNPRMESPSYACCRTQAAGVARIPVRHGFGPYLISPRFERQSQHFFDMNTKCPAHLVNPGPWRRFLDLEHSTVYNETVHWNALTGTPGL